MSTSQESGLTSSEEIIANDLEQTETPTEPTEWRVIIRSITGRKNLCYTVTILPEDTPQSVLQKLQTLYRTKISRRKRFVDRYLLLHKPNIMSGHLSAMSHSSSSTNSKEIVPQVFISSPSRDDVLTTAFHKPETLINVDHSLFFSEYSGFTVGPDTQGPTRACVIGQEVDQRSIYCLRIILMVVSLTLGIVGGVV